MMFSMCNDANWAVDATATFNVLNENNTLSVHFTLGASENDNETYVENDVF